MEHVCIKTDLKYDFSSDVEKLIRYIYNPQKTVFRDGEKNKMLVYCNSGGLVFGPPGMLVHLTSELFEMNHIFWGKSMSNLVHHIIISFNKGDEGNMPLYAYKMGVWIAQFYYNLGYLCCFGVHLNEDHVHIHFCVDNISYINGKRFFYEKEYLAINENIEDFKSKVPFGLAYFTI